MISGTVGRVPTRSSETRRRNSASVLRSEGTMPSFRSLSTTSRSISVGISTFGYFLPTLSLTGLTTGTGTTPLS